MTGLGTAGPTAGPTAGETVCVVSSALPSRPPVGAEGDGIEADGIRFRNDMPVFSIAHAVAGIKWGSDRTRNSRHIRR